MESAHGESKHDRSGWIARGDGLELIAVRRNRPIFRVRAQLVWLVNHWRRRHIGKEVYHWFAACLFVTAAERVPQQSKDRP